MIGLADINAVDQRSKEGGHSETQKVEKRCHVVGSSQAPAASWDSSTYSTPNLAVFIHHVVTSANTTFSLSPDLTYQQSKPPFQPILR